ncbi:MAG: fibronectin type III domain-containing protein, partial [Patescibacteria group bacterium]
GNTATGFYRYSISGNTWTTLTVAPGAVWAGSFMLRNGADNDIYVLQGNTATGFYRYSISGNTWTTLTVVPSAVISGAVALRNSAEDYIYVLPSNSTAYFYRYSISGNTWTTLTAVPSSGYGGRALRNGADNDIYILQINTSNFYRYSISGNTWTTLTVKPGAMAEWGSQMLRNGSDPEFYVLEGNNTNNFYKYTINTPTYQTSGNFTSASITGAASYYSLSWTPAYQATSTTSTPGTASLKFQVAANNDNSTWNFVGSDGTGSTYFETPSTTIPAGVTGSYFRWKAYFSTANTAYTPVLFDVTLNYAAYGQSGWLTSSYYDSGSDANIVNKIQWDEGTLPAGTDLRFQVRSSTSTGSMSTSTWMGTDGTANTYFTDPAGGETFPAYLRDGQGDRVYQYKAFLTSDGSATPSLNDATMTYVVNASPEAQSVTASQNSNGTVTISYQVRDSDTNEGSQANQYKITPSFQYFNGLTWATISTLAAGDTSTKTVATSTWNTYTATWTATTDFASQATSTAKIRVTANDGEAANNTGSADSANFTLDTTAPSLASFIVSASSTPAATLYISASDYSSFQMKISVDSALSGASWQTYAASTTISLVTDPDIVYIQLKDAYSNTTAISSVTSPESPTNLVVQDTSYVAATPYTYRLFSAWKVVSSGFASYKIYRSTDQSSWTLLTTIADVNTNYYTDTSPSADTLYYYRVIVWDSSGNHSAYTSAVSARANGAQDAGEGGGAAVPTISNVSTTTTPTTAVITWDTDSLSDSRVGHSASSGNFTSSSSPVSSMLNTSAGVGADTIVLAGLTANTTYYAQVCSVTVSSGISCSNNSGPGHSFTTLNGVTISGAATEQVTNTTAKIVWTTSAAADSYVVYSTSADLSTTAAAGSDTASTAHSVTVTGLTAGTKYYYYVKSTANGITAMDKNVVSSVIKYYSFTTTIDNTSPTISNVSASAAETWVDIAWTTNEDADTQVEYGGSDSYGATTTLSSTLTAQHVAQITGLTNNTTYHYRARSSDANSNTAWSADKTFLTATTVVPVTNITIGGRSMPRDTQAPLISNVVVGSITKSSVLASWDTDEYGDSHVAYGTTAAYGSWNVNFEPVINHKMTLANLAADTAYNLQVYSIDQSGNRGQSSNQTFKTLSVAAEAALPSAMKPKEEPKAAEDKEKNLLESIKAAPANLLNKILDAIKINPYLKDISEETFTSAFVEMTSKVVEPPSIVGLKPQVEVKGNVAFIKWTTDKKATSAVAYVKESEFKSSEPEPYKQLVLNPDEFSTFHNVTLENLEPATTYHFQVRSKGSIGPEAMSKDFIFTTQSELPQISDIRLEAAKDNIANISWVTNVQTQATVEYTNQATRVTLTQGDTAFLRDHKFTLKNLDSGVGYLITLKVKDNQGNETQSTPIRFSTSLDTSPPAISKVTSDSTIYPGKESKVQTVITWETDEPATGQVFYQEGVAKDAKVITLPKDNALNLKHITVITKFKPGAVYKYWAESVDNAGNIAASQVFTILTPQERETIFDIISNNFSQVFGWTKKIGF